MRRSVTSDPVESQEQEGRTRGPRRERERERERATLWNVQAMMEARQETREGGGTRGTHALPACAGHRFLAGERTTLASIETMEEGEEEEELMGWTGWDWLMSMAASRT